MSEAFTNKKVAGIAPEVPGAFGDFVQPVAPWFPVNDVEIPTPDLSISEYGRPANGTTQRGKQLSNAQTFAWGFTSFMNPLADIPSDNPDAGVTIINTDLFKMGGWRYREIEDLPTNPGTFFVEVYFDHNAICTTYSWELDFVGCYDSSQSPLTPTVPSQWYVRGAKCDLSIAAEKVGAPVIITAAAQGAIEARNDDGTATTFDLDTVQDFENIDCDRFLGAAVTIDAADLEVTSFSYAQGAQIGFKDDPSKATITKLAYIGDSDPKLTLTSYVGASTAGYWGKAATNTPIGDVVIQCQLYTYTFEDCMVTSYGEQDADGLLVLTMECSVRGEPKIRSNVKK